MKVKYFLFTTLTIFVTLACSIFSNSPQQDLIKTPLSSTTENAESTLESTNQPVKVDDGFRYPIGGCGKDFGYINRQGDLLIPALPFLTGKWVKSDQNV
ncbi:MAG: hypothetical protein IT315_11395 [Anaerolineales bacterium]|nr:hypothetical protein [Anaerolineales bacterium]